MAKNEDIKRVEADIFSQVMNAGDNNLNGIVRNFGATIKVESITITLDASSAWALCNLLYDSQLETNYAIDKRQREQLSLLGVALGRMIDHPARENGGHKLVEMVAVKNKSS